MEKNENAKIAIFLASMIFLLGFFLGGGISAAIMEHRARVDAVERGHGRWIAASDGSTTFEWNTSCSVKKSNEPERQ